MDSERPGAQAPSTAAPRGYAVAPKEIWLQLHGDCSDDELDEPVNYEHNDDVSWCWHEIHSSDVRYVRADLAAPSTGGAETAGWRFDDSRPDADEVVLVVYRTNPRHEHGGKPSIHRARFSGGQWRFIDDAVQERRQDGVVCWMPLPPIPGIHEAPASSAPAQAVETAGVREQDFEKGWRTAANWMERDDLIADIGSAAYLKDRAAALQSPAASPASKEDGSHE